MHLPAFLFRFVGKLRTGKDRAYTLISFSRVRLEQFQVWARQPGPDGEIELAEDGHPKPTTLLSELIRVNMTGTWNRHYW